MSVSVTPTPAAGDTPAAQPISLRTRILYGSGAQLDHWGVQGVKVTASSMLNIGLGINPAVVGIIMGLTRLWDALLGPFMGVWSDRTRTRWGRRRPFIFVGALGCTVIFPALWIFPTDFTATAKNVWVFAAAFLFYSAFTAFNVPYRALAYELGERAEDSTKLIATRMIMASACILMIKWAFPITQLGWLGDPVTSIRILAIFIAVVFGLLALIPAVFLIERPLQSDPVSLTSKGPSTLRKLYHAFIDRDMRLLLIATFVSAVFSVSVSLLGNYVIIYYMFKGDVKLAAVLLGAYATVAGLSVLVITPLAERLSKLGLKRALLIAYGCGMVVSLAKWWAFNPVYPYAVFLLQPFWMFSNLSIMLMQESIVGLIIARPGRNGEKKQAGVFTAAYAEAVKGGNALAVALSGILLVVIGFDVSLGPDQTPFTLTAMRMLFTFMPFIGLGLATLCIMRIIKTE